MFSRIMKKEEFLCDLGKKIQYYRNKNKLSQSQLAEKMNRSIHSISRIENGKCFAKLSTIFKLASIFDIEVYKLFVPDNIKYDDLSDHISKFSNQVIEFLNDFKDGYLKI